MRQTAPPAATHGATATCPTGKTPQNQTADDATQTPYLMLYHCALPNTKPEKEANIFSGFQADKLYAKPYEQAKNPMN
jgi:hypothetical protein